MGARRRPGKGGRRHPVLFGAAVSRPPENAYNRATATLIPARKRRRSMRNAKSSALEVPRRLRVLVRAREVGIVGLAGVVGGVAGLVVTVMAAIFMGLHQLFFDIPSGTRLSASAAIDPLHALLVPTIGGLLLGIAGLLLARWDRNASSIRSRRMRCAAGGCRFAAA